MFKKLCLINLGNLDCTRKFIIVQCQTFFYKSRKNVIQLKNFFFCPGIKIKIAPDSAIKFISFAVSGDKMRKNYDCAEIKRGKYAKLI